MTLILSNDNVGKFLVGKFLVGKFLVGKFLTMPDCITALEEVYAELAEDRGVTRTRSDCFTSTSREDALYGVKSMDGVILKLDVGAVRINSDIVGWPKRSNQGMIRKKPALGLDPGVDFRFPKRSCSNKKSNRIHSRCLLASRDSASVHGSAAPPCGPSGRFGRRCDALRHLIAVR
jgi:hypothetical protein